MEYDGIRNRELADPPIMAWSIFVGRKHELRSIVVLCCKRVDFGGGKNGGEKGVVTGSHDGGVQALSLFVRLSLVHM